MAIIRTLLQIILFKAKPSDVPFNINATTIAFAAAWMTSLFTATLQPSNPNPLIFTLVQIGTLGGMIGLFLLINKKQARLHQTLLASFGAIALINIIMFALITVGLGALIFVIAVWSFAVQVYILKNALETGVVQGIFLTITIQITILFFISLFFPEFLEAYAQAIKEAQSQ